MKHFSFVRRVVAIFLLLILLPASVMLVVQNAVVSGRSREQIIENAKLLSNRYVMTLDGKMDNIAQMVRTIAADKNLRMTLASSERKRMDGDAYLAFRAFRDSMSSYQTFAGLKLYSLCLTNTGSIIRQFQKSRFATLPGGMPSETEWFQRTIAAGGAVVWNGVAWEGEAGDTPVISASCCVRDTDAKIVGTINAAYSAREIFSYDVSMGNDEYLLYYCAVTGETYAESVYSCELIEAARSMLAAEDDAGSVVLDGKSYLLVKSDTGQHGWSAFYALPSEAVFSSVRFMSLLLVATLAVCITCMLMFLGQMYRKLLHPLNDAVEFINRNGNSTALLRSNRHGYPELNIIQEKVTSLMRRQHDMQESLEKLGSENKENKINRLRMQLNPHFLYNTLNSIKILADRKDTESVSRLIYDLTHLLQACMRQSTQKVTLAKEIAVLGKYIDIEQSVLDNSVAFSVEPAENTMEALVPNFILQPLVENALQHGIDRSKANAYVKITSEEKDDILRIYVEDNGLGMTEEKLREVIANMESGDLAAHYGLKSVHQRIMLMYGVQYGIRVDSEPEKGTKFTIEIPAEWSDGEEDDRFVSGYYR